MHAFTFWRLSEVFQVANHSFSGYIAALVGAAGWAYCLDSSAAGCPSAFVSVAFVLGIEAICSICFVLSFSPFFCGTLFMAGTCSGVSCWVCWSETYWDVESIYCVESDGCSLSLSPSDCGLASVDGSAVAGGSSWAGGWAITGGCANSSYSPPSHC